MTMEFFYADRAGFQKLVQSKEFQLKSVLPFSDVRFEKNYI